MHVLALNKEGQWPYAEILLTTPGAFQEALNQVQTFKQHFTITDVARARVEANAQINFDDFKEYQNDPETFLIEAIWNIESGNIIKSEGHYIRHVPTNDFIKQISSINDVANFIENDMADYLAKHQWKGKSND